jgi:glycosyltransferase involved in cell wall biosynthesis
MPTINPTTDRVAPSATNSPTRDQPAICLNGRFLQQEMTGVQRYAEGLLAALSPRLRVIRPGRKLRAIEGHLWEQFALPRRCKGALLWSPGNTGPLSVRNQVVTVHDASTLDHPEWFSRKFALWYRWLLPRLMNRVEKIITVSEFSRERLIATCAVPAEKIAVVHNAIDASFQAVTSEAGEAWRKKNGLDRPYLLYVGSLEPRKNISVLLRAWPRLGLRDHELLVAGASGHVFREKGFDDLPAGVRLVGRVKDEELRTLLSGAECFVFPSLYEGFGYPPLEAMACGCPTVSSRATCLPEVCGAEFDPADPASTGATLYFDPNDPEELAQQIRRVLALSPETRGRLRQNGFARAQVFNWGRCAAQTSAVLDGVLKA